MNLSDEQRALVEANIGLAGWAVRHVGGNPSHYLSGGRDDLYSAALEALCRAALRFDPGRGVTFAAYAAQRLRGAVLDELRRDSRSARVKAGPLSADGARASDDPTPEELVVARLDAARRVGELRDRLPRWQFRALEGYAAAGGDIAAAARSLGLARGSMWTTMYRARQSAREVLAEEDAA